MEKLLILRKKVILIGLLLFGMLLLSCGTTNSYRKIGSDKSTERTKIDYNGQIAKIIKQRIKAKMKECPKGWSKKKCEARSTLYVEAEVWAEVLESDFKLVDAYLEDGYVKVVVKRGKEAPLVGEITVGKFKNIRSVSLVDDGLEVQYESQAELNARQKAAWFGGGAGTGAGTVVIILIIILLL